MKSEKAKQHLSRWAMNPNSPIAQDQNYVWRDVSVIEAIEIAEREAEERMREKAAKAFKFACTDNYGGECWANDDHHVKCSGKCAKMNDFIQKLNENEND